jgi:hypothetical protein
MVTNQKDENSSPIMRQERSFFGEMDAKVQISGKIEFRDVPIRLQHVGCIVHRQDREHYRRRFSGGGLSLADLCGVLVDGRNCVDECAGDFRTPDRHRGPVGVDGRVCSGPAVSSEVDSAILHGRPEVDVGFLCGAVFVGGGHVLECPSAPSVGTFDRGLCGTQVSSRRVEAAAAVTIAPGFFVTVLTAVTALPISIWALRNRP